MDNPSYNLSMPTCPTKRYSYWVFLATNWGEPARSNPPRCRKSWKPWWLAVAFRYTMKLWMNHFVHFHVILLGRARQDFESHLLGSTLCLIVKISILCNSSSTGRTYLPPTLLAMGQPGPWIWRFEVLCFGQSSPVLFSSRAWAQNHGGFLSRGRSKVCSNQSGQWGLHRISRPFCDVSTICGLSDLDGFAVDLLQPLQRRLTAFFFKRGCW